MKGVDNYAAERYSYCKFLLKKCVLKNKYHRLIFTLLTYLFNLFY